MKHSNSFWKRTIIGCSLLGMVIVTALPAQAAVQAATLNERTVSAVSTYTGTNAALATSKTAAINTATSTTNTTTNDATLTASKTTAKKAALNKTSLKLKKGKTYQLKTKNVKGMVTWKSSNKKIATVSKKGKVTAKKAGSTVIKATYKKNGKVKTLKCKVTVTAAKKESREETVKKKILALQNTYKEGTTWTNDDFYLWKAKNMYCYGCIALAGKISDTVFGKDAPVKTHKDFSAIKSGDHIRIGNYHSVIVISHTSDSVTVVEGNYNSSIHWFRTITKSSLQQTGFSVDTRY
jgi:PAB1-binding protein PBP1